MSKEEKVYKFSKGYVVYDIIPRVYLKTDLHFDWAIYNKPRVEYESISMQLYNLLLKIYNNIIYFILNFFGSLSF